MMRNIYGIDSIKNQSSSPLPHRIKDREFKGDKRNKTQGSRNKACSQLTAFSSQLLPNPYFCSKHYLLNGGYTEQSH